MEVIEQKLGLRSHRVSRAMLWSLRLRRRLTPLLTTLGRIESKIVARRMRRPERPIYVTGLARGGTTISLELLSEHRDLACHHYVDLFNPFMPYLWDRVSRVGTCLFKMRPFERAQADGMLVLPEAPDVVEELIWCAYFPRAHDETHTSTLSPALSCPAFERTYADTLAKLVAARGASRYLSKNNYNITRLEYLLRLFPDARFIVVLRHPVLHVAGLVKAHMLYQDLQRTDPGWRDLPALAGHWDFGPQMRFINVDVDKTQRMRALAEQGRLVESYALYWSCLFNDLHQRLASNDALRRATLIVRHEDLCEQPRATVAHMAQHCGLELDKFAPARPYEERVKPPRNYRVAFSAPELEALHAQTKTVGACFGYQVPADVACTRPSALSVQ